ncbi:hypothetical protein K3495_g1554 [Podosphaera aphanis]|nr:hypothetical protein K3495_g1554 [Podosphaera aphanis]
MTAAYLVNRTPTSTLDLNSPLSKLRRVLGIPDRDEYSHLKAFGCTVYALDKSIPKDEKMKPRANTGFLAGYNSRNIYRILLLDKEVVIGTRDVVFDETLFFDNEQQPILDEELIIIPLIDFQMISSVSDIIVDEDDPAPIRNNEPDSYTNDNEIFKDYRTKDELESHVEKQNGSEMYYLGILFILLKRLKTDASTSQKNSRGSIKDNKDMSQEDRLVHKNTAEKLPMSRVNPSDIDESHIISGKRIRKKTEKAGNLDPSALVATINVFIIGKAKDLKRFHQSELPLPPSNWRELRNHSHSQEFRDAMLVEYDTLVAKNTIKKVEQSNSMNPIPLRWVFTYKFDESGYLLKFKARICVRGDL